MWWAFKKTIERVKQTKGDVYLTHIADDDVPKLRTTWNYLKYVTIITLAVFVAWSSANTHLLSITQTVDRVR